MSFVGPAPEARDLSTTRKAGGATVDRTMIFDPYLSWLGFRTRRPVVGMHVTTTDITIVALRRRPLRLVAIGRRTVPDAAVVGGEIRLVEPLAAELRTLVANVRIESGSPTVAVIEPLADTVSITTDRSVGAACDVADRTYQGIAEVVTGAGLSLRGVEAVPVALARLGRRAGAPAVALDGPNGWTAALDPDRLRARRAAHHEARPTLRLGMAPEVATAVAELPGIAVPSALRPLVDPGRDAVAIGGALAAFGDEPHVIARPAAVAVGSGWTVQRVDRLASVGRRPPAVANDSSRPDRHTLDCLIFGKEER